MGTDVIVFNSHSVGQLVEIQQLPKLGETINGRNWRIAQDGGKGSNCSIALGRMGIKTAYIGKVGYDIWGDLGERWMKEAGVDVSCLLRSDDVSTGTGLIMLMKNGQNTIIHGESSCRAMMEKEIVDCIDLHKEAKIFISGFEIPMEKALYGIRYAKTLGMTTILNLSPVPDEQIPILDFVDMVIINEQESRAIDNFTEDKHTNIEAMLNRLTKKYRCGKIIVTLGSKGAATLDDQQQLVGFRAPKVKAIDSTGAGDAFIAAFAAGLIWNYDINKAIEWATHYSAFTVTNFGTIPSYPLCPDVESIYRRLKKEEENYEKSKNYK